MNSFNIDAAYYNMSMYVILTAYSPADHSPSVHQLQLFDERMCKDTTLFAFILRHSIATGRRTRLTIPHFGPIQLPLALVVRTRTHSLTRLEALGLLGDEATLGAARSLVRGYGAHAAMAGSHAPLRTG